MSREIVRKFGDSPQCELRASLMHESQLTLFLSTKRNANDDLLVRSGHPAETRRTGKSKCAADAFLLLISLTLDNAFNAKLREPQRSTLRMIALQSIKVPRESRHQRLKLRD